MSPTVSVLLPVYNSQTTIGQTIDSILNQTYTDFELIVINDGSVDDSKSIILSFDDARILYFENDGNKGLIYTLNRGIELCKGKYIARMDADDMMVDNRLESQVDYMEHNDDVVVAGSGVYRMTGDKMQPSSCPVKDVHLTLYFHNPIIHPASIIRRETLVKHNIEYDANFVHAEDYKFWYDLSKVGRLANVNEMLLIYRNSSTQVSKIHNAAQTLSALKTRRLMVFDFLKRCGIEIEDKMDVEVLKKFKRHIKNHKKELELDRAYTVLSICYLSLDMNWKMLVDFIFSFMWLDKAFAIRNAKRILLHGLGIKNYERFSIQP